MTKPALLLLPNVLGEVKHHQPYLPNSVDKAVATIDGLIAESEKAGRRFLGRFETKKPAREIPIAVFNAKTSDEDIDFFLQPIRDGQRWGLVSDAGLPCIADPGAKLVDRARKSGIAVQGFSGPCSFIHALMLSGLPGQQFTFHGYLSKEEKDRQKQIQEMLKKPVTHIFMERPYRNQTMLQELVGTLPEKTILCAAWELMMPDQGIVSQEVQVWRKSPLPNLEDKEAVFLLLPA
jgi:16S rRNA (cytidine1402-2'-O)-methyltransferase